MDEVGEIDEVDVVTVCKGNVRRHPGQQSLPVKPYYDDVNKEQHRQRRSGVKEVEEVVDVNEINDTNDLNEVNDGANIHKDQTFLRHVTVIKLY